MSDIYTPPPRTAYYLAQAFYMPSDKGDHWAIAFSGKSAVLVASALSVIVTLCFALLWKIICFFALLVKGTGSRRRYVAMVTLWNSGDALPALWSLLQYTFKCYPHKVDGPQKNDQQTSPQKTSIQETKDAGQPEKVRNGLWSDFLYGLTLCLICFVVWGGSLAMSTVTSWIVSIGSVAPVNPDVLFYPQVPGLAPVLQLKDFGLRAPGIMRSLGSVEAAKVTLRSRVNVTRVPLGNIFNPNTNASDLLQDLYYDYRLTGVELGLRSGNDLGLGVKGSCRTEYDWYRPNGSTADVELYHLWNNKDQNWTMGLSNVAIARAPTAAFQLPSTYLQQGPPKDSNFSYAVIVTSVHRTSITEGSDPWYNTELRGNLNVSRPFDAKFWMRRARPILSCWEQMRWSYKGVNVSSINELRNQPNWDMPDVLLRVLEANFFAGPMIFRLGNASGDSALRSRTTSPNGVIDASISSIESDMERLVLASFVASRNIFVDATMFGGSDQNYPNVFRAGNGQAEPGSGHFVVSSPDIQTFSLTGIVTLVAILVFLLALEGLLMLLIHLHRGNVGNEGLWSRFSVLEAVQLFRCLYEEKTDFPAWNGWNCDWPVPETIVRGYGGKTCHIESDLCKLSRCDHGHCLGHINRRPPANDTKAKNGKATSDEAANKQNSATTVSRQSFNKEDIPSPEVKEVTNPMDHR